MDAYQIVIVLTIFVGHRSWRIHICIHTCLMNWLQIVKIIAQWMMQPTMARDVTDVGYCHVTGDLYKREITKRNNKNQKIPLMDTVMRPQPLRELGWSQS